MNKQLKLASMLMMMCAGNAMAPGVDSTAVRPAGTSVMNSVRPVIICHRLQPSSPIQVSDEFLQQSLDSVDGIKHKFWHEVSVPYFKASSALLHYLNDDHSYSYNVDQDGTPLTYQDAQIMEYNETKTPLEAKRNAAIRNIDQKLSSFEQNITSEANVVKDMINTIYRQQQNKDAITMMLSAFKNNSSIKDQMTDILSAVLELSQCNDQLQELRESNAEQKKQQTQHLKEVKQKVDVVMSKYYDDLMTSANNIINTLQDMRNMNQDDTVEAMFKGRYIEDIDSDLTLLLSRLYQSYDKLLHQQRTQDNVQNVEDFLNRIKLMYDQIQNQITRHVKQIESLSQKEYTEDEYIDLIRDLQKFADTVKTSLTLCSSEEQKQAMRNAQQNQEIQAMQNAEQEMQKLTARNEAIREASRRMIRSAHMVP